LRPDIPSRHPSELSDGPAAGLESLASQPETFLFEAHPIRNPAKARQSIGVSVMTYAGKLLFGMQNWL
jgi:hypothetical protein